MQIRKIQGYSSNTFFWEKDKMKKLKIKNIKDKQGMISCFKVVEQ